MLKNSVKKPLARIYRVNRSAASLPISTIVNQNAKELSANTVGESYNQPAAVIMIKSKKINIKDIMYLYIRH